MRFASCRVKYTVLNTANKRLSFYFVVFLKKVKQSALVSRLKQDLITV